MTEKLKDRAARCVIHHAACDCREYAYRERIERLEGALRECEEYFDQRADSEDTTDEEMGLLFTVREALADDGSGGGEQKHPHWADVPGIDDEEGPTPPPNRDALEALDRLAERAIRAARGKEPEITDDYATVGEFIRRAFTAPPTVPDAVRELPEKWEHEAELAHPRHKSYDEYNGGCRDAMEMCADELDRALAQHSEPENEDAGNT